MTQRVLERSMLGVSLLEHILSKLIWEWNEGYDHSVPKAEVPLSWVCYKIYWNQVEPCSCQVKSKRPETATQKTDSIGK